MITISAITSISLRMTVRTLMTFFIALSGVTLAVAQTTPPSGNIPTPPAASETKPAAPGAESTAPAGKGGRGQRHAQTPVEPAHQSDSLTAGRAAHGRAERFSCRY